MFVGIDLVPLWICVACLGSLQAAPVPAQGPLYLDMAADIRMSSQQPEGLAEAQAAREIKRYDSYKIYCEAITSVVSKASAGIQNRDRLIAQASAFIYPASSKTSEHNEEAQENNDPKLEDVNIKESVMYTLFRAANAITGGVTILKGQLIRGSGALAVELGKVIAVEDDAADSPDNKLVSSTKLWNKNPNPTAVSGPPWKSHQEYKRSGTPPATLYFTTPFTSTDHAMHRYPSQLDEIIENEIEPSAKAEDIMNISDDSNDGNNYETGSDEDSYLLT
ncbi:hypothetical protein PYW07_001487 [Mythimna separata]|uniref:Uncharacterized protein n=1 Tax=Mythimna separata TaxID=271217 RepID=A0AAD8DW06_MYTSE|nr:hypothetical protein PYW07_001487 [Mythimna separata]